jgi:GT2 family glycosyltransferase
VTLPQNIFAEMPMWFEDTYLGLRLCLENKKVLFLNDPTVIHHISYTFSCDRSKEAIFNRPQAFEQILIKLSLPEDIRINYERYLGGLHLKASIYYLWEKNYLSAWKHYKKAILGREGLKYLLRTTHYINYYKNQYAGNYK